jgi:drug/metabolite transporter (DMT)-like permease
MDASGGLREPLLGHEKKKRVQIKPLLVDTHAHAGNSSRATPTWVQGCIVVIATLLGASCTLLVKWMYSQQPQGFSEPFEKPLFSTSIMFLAMILAVVPFSLLVENSREHLTADIYKVLASTAVLDALSTVFAKIGLIHCALSTYQLVRCGVVVFVALFKLLLLKNVRMSRPQLAGIALNCIGVVCLV